MTGFFHFYENGYGVKFDFGRCQCPMTGFFHFYPAEGN